MTQFHRAISLDVALQMGYEEYKVPLQWIEHCLLGTLPSSDLERIVKEALLFAKEHPYHRDHFVLLHNDLHGENFAFNMDMQKVEGVFDFSDAAIGHYSIEFGKLFCVDSDLAIRTLDLYAQLNGVSNSIIPSAVDYILRRCTYLLTSRELNNESRELSLVKMLEDFVPVWDEIFRQ